MTLLDNHLGQISLSSAAITELPYNYPLVFQALTLIPLLRFPPPKIFTNALLQPHDITALIRDTESHERALFSLAPSDRDAAGFQKGPIHPSQNHEQSFLNGSGLARRPKQGSAVAALLGGELGAQILREDSKDVKERSEIDVELLLKGAERLCGVYPIPGAPEKISVLRARHGRLVSSISRFEARVSKQTGQLARMKKRKSFGEEIDDLGEVFDGSGMTLPAASEEAQTSAHDFRLEQEEIQELEKKKRALEDRVAGMERDLTALSQYT